jgi:hypothetical protein
MANNEKDILGVDLEVNNDQDANAKIDRFHKNLIETENLINNMGKNAKFAGEFSAKLAEVERRAAQTQRAFLGFARFDTKGIDGITQAAIRLQTESIKVQQRLANIKATDTAGKSETFIKLLETDARAAERQLSRLEATAARLNQRRANAPGGGGLGLSSFQKTNLSFQANDVISGLLSGQNPTQIAAQQGGQIAQIFSPAQVSALIASYGTLVGIIGAGAAAIALTYKITGDIRSEAERRLKVEEQINSAINNQILSQQRGFENARREREQARFDRSFDRSFSGETVESLQERRRRAEQLFNLTPATLPTIGPDGKIQQKENDSFRQQLERIKRFDKEIEDLQNKRANFDRGTIFQDNFRIEADAARFRAEQAEKFKQSVEKAKGKIKEVSTEISTFFAGLFGRSDNPFVRIFRDGDAAIEQTRKTTRLLSKDLQDLAIQMTTDQNNLALFNARLDARLGAFDLTEQAAAFRGGSRNPATTINREALIAALAAGTTVGVQGAPLLSRQNPFFAMSDVNRQGLISALARQQNGGTDPNLSFQDRLQKQIDIVQNLAASNDLERQAADRRIIALTNGIDPARLDASQRDIAAGSREREAARLLNQEREANKKRDKQIEINAELLTEIKKLVTIAEREGFQGIVRIIDDTPGSVDISTNARRPGDNSTKKLMP